MVATVFIVYDFGSYSARALCILFKQAVYEDTQHCITSQILSDDFVDVIILASSLYVAAVMKSVEYK